MAALTMNTATRLARRGSRGAPDLCEAEGSSSSPTLSSEGLSWCDLAGAVLEVLRLLVVVV